MTTPNQVVGAPSARDIEWKAVESHVQKLQLRIAKAVKHSRAKSVGLRRA